MRNEVVLDIETQNTFQDIGARDPSQLRVSLVGCYFYASDTFEAFFEKELPRLWPRLEHADRVIGYNLFGFDYPCLRSYYTGDFRNIPTVDVMVELEKRLGFRLKLDDVAHATLGVGKSGHGLQAVEFWRKGELDKLRDYCLQDVRVTRDVYAYALAHQELKYRDRAGRIQSVPFPILPPTQEQRVPLNLSLGL